MIAVLIWAVALAAAVSLTTSLAVAAAGRLSAPFASLMEPRARARLWLAVALAPAVISAGVLAAVLVPREWVGLEDHCVHHLHHLHLCARHGAPWPPAALVALAAVWAARVLGLWAQRAHDGLRAQRSIRRVSGPGDTRLGGTRLGDTVRLPLPGPVAFTAGWLSPRVYATAVVVDDPRWSAVIAHERDHARHRDPLARLVARFALALHAPLIADWLDRQIVGAQEHAADDAAAEHLGDRLEVARQLVAWVRAHRLRPAGAGFEQGDVSGRVRALMDRARYRAGPSTHAIVSAAVALVWAALALAGPIHHAVETFLGAIGA